MIRFSKSSAYTSKRILTAIAISALAACGGGGGGGGSSSGSSGNGGSGSEVDRTGYTRLSNTASAEQTPLTFVAVTNSNQASQGRTGNLDHDTGAVTGGILRGVANGQRTVINLNGGGVANLSRPAGTEYLMIFNTEIPGQAPRFGVVGQATLEMDLPSSQSTSYEGVVNLTVAEGNTVQAMSGRANLTTNWTGTGGRVNSTFSNFREINADGSRGGTVGGSMTISGANITGTRFSGGSLSTSGSAFDVTNSANIGGTRGQFFGPEAIEVGGRLIVDDTSNGTRQILGTFSAD